ncbi:MAG: hypothetical protein H0W72_03950 [Planctomycetes bacterium]|nr:hypothetical protein [Planctomycetota bacterium]
MKYPVLGLAACLASLTAPTLAAMEMDLATGPQDLRASFELLNKLYDEHRVVHPDATGEVTLIGRYWDIGIRLTGDVAIDGDHTTPDSTHTFETVRITGRIDYLIEIQDYVQIIPFVESKTYPHITGAAPFNWAGADVWYLTPIEGIELGGSAAYNLFDNTDYQGHDNHWIGTIGVRELYQDAPIDFIAWQTVDLASRSYHEIISGADTQGITTLNIGGQLTLPLPWEETWATLMVEGHWWLGSDDKDALELAGTDPGEIVFGIGFEYRAD